GAGRPEARSGARHPSAIEARAGALDQSRGGGFLDELFLLARPPAALVCPVEQAVLALVCMAFLRSSLRRIDGQCRASSWSLVHFRAARRSGVANDVQLLRLRSRRRLR